MENKSNINTILLTIILTILVVGGGCYLWQQSRNDAIENTEVTIDNDVEVEDEEVVDDVAVSTEKKMALDSIQTANYSQTVKLNKISDYSVVLYSPDSEEDTTEGCQHGYRLGHFTLGLVDKNGIIVNNIDLGELSVPAKDALHTDSFSVSLPSAVDDSTNFLMVESYWGCNNNSFNFYYFDKESGELKAANFDDTKSNVLYAYKITDIDFELMTVAVRTYDNSKAEWVEKSYTWDEEKMEFKNS
ncbi:MAG: hypothetical protein AAB373_03290 [Patescibacteria group bacterium]